MVLGTTLPSTETAPTGAGAERHIALVGMPAWDITMPFHALAAVAGIVRDAGLPVSVHDVNIDFYHHLAEQDRKRWTAGGNDCWPSEDYCREFWQEHQAWLQKRLDEIVGKTPPALIAFSVNMTTRHFSINAAKYLKQRWPEMPVLFGGVDCFPAEKFTEFLGPDDPYCDIICQGEAEIALRDYLARFAELGDWRTDVAGFAYYRDGRLVNTGNVELPTLRGDLPLPAFDLFDLSKYTRKGKLPFFFSRGCVYKCHFCSERSNFDPFRCRKAEDSFEALTAILPLAQRHAKTPSLSLADSNLNANMKQLRKFVDLIIENDVKIIWGGQAHFGPALTTEFLERLAASGFRSVFWGFESASQHVIDLMNKQYNQADARRILDDCSRVGIAQHLPILIGFPGETPTDLVDSLEFILQYRDKPHCTIHMPHAIVVRPNSTLYDDYAKFGLANNNYFNWSTADGVNTLEVRMARVFVAKQAQDNPTLSMDHLVKLEQLARVDFNRENVAKDIFLTLCEVSSRAGWLPQFFAAVADWSKRDGHCDDNPQSDATRADHLARWMRLDKNSAPGRETLYALILSSLGELKKSFSGQPATGGLAA